MAIAVPAQSSHYSIAGATEHVATMAKQIRVDLAPYIDLAHLVPPPLHSRALVQALQLVRLARAVVKDVAAAVREWRRVIERAYIKTAARL